MDDTKLNLLSTVSYYSRSLNRSKKLYLRHLLSDCDILFLQEHWQSETQLSDLCTDHSAMGVSGFGNNDVLSGIPYGGCAFFWRKSLLFTPVYVTTDSRRVCAIRLNGVDCYLLCLCVYRPMPHEKATENLDEFSYQLSVIESILVCILTVT